MRHHSGPQQLNGRTHCLQNLPTRNATRRYIYVGLLKRSKAKNTKSIFALPVLTGYNAIMERYEFKLCVQFPHAVRGKQVIVIIL